MNYPLRLAASNPSPQPREPLLPMAPPRIPKELRARLKDPTPVWVVSHRETGVIKMALAQVTTRAEAVRFLLGNGLAKDHRVDQW